MKEIFIFQENETYNLRSGIEAVVQMCSVKKVILKILQNSQENNCARVSFFIKLQRLWHGCFPVKFAEIL